MRNKIAFALVAITAVFTTIGLTVADPAGAISKPDDCNRVAKADRPLCRQVGYQMPYAYATKGGNLNQVVGGKAVVYDITHQGLTKGEMRSYLRGEALNYARYAVAPGSIIVNTATMRKYIGTDAHYEVHTQGKEVAVSVVQP
jgi:ribosomal protein L35AE/L33A